MKRLTLLTVLFFLLFGGLLWGQVKEQQFKTFIGKQEVLHSSGPGLKAKSGDILLNLQEGDDTDVVTLMILRSQNGKLSKVAENSGLLMGNSMLGNSGSGNANLSGNQLLIQYSIGSNSGYSQISMLFEKEASGNYLFKEYTERNSNYGVENLFTRQGIFAAQTGKINFSEASENLIFKKAGKVYDEESRNAPYASGDPAPSLIQQYLLENWRLGAFAMGDLNLDPYKKDFILIANDDDVCIIKIFLQQKDGTYKLSQQNKILLVPEGNVPIVSNIRVVIKNGFFTLEQRKATSEENFDHHYTTFKYDPQAKNWFLHQYAIEHYLGFNSKPESKVDRYTPQPSEKIAFAKLNRLPEIKTAQSPVKYRYSPEVSTLSGILINKLVYGRPNYGESPETDEKGYILVLKPDQPINVYADPHQPDPETADRTILNQTEIQTYSADPKLQRDLSKYLNKKVKLRGVLLMGITGGHYTPVLLEVDKILP